MADVPTAADLVDVTEVEALTLEAFADTIIPGERRHPDDVAVAGAVTGPGAVAAGALTVLRLPATGITEALPPLVAGLNAYATGFAAQLGLPLDASLPPFVALPFEVRTAVVRAATALDNPEREGFVVLAMFSTMAFDSAPHLHTVDALAAGHPGLRAMGFADPDRDGLWRFPGYSYGRALAALHPLTTASGSPA